MKEGIFLKNKKLHLLNYIILTQYNIEQKHHNIELTHHNIAQLPKHGSSVF